MGGGVYGVETASQRYFGKSAGQLSAREAALIAAVLPNPRKWSPHKAIRLYPAQSLNHSGAYGGVALPRDHESEYV